MAARTPDSFESDSPLESPSSLPDSPSQSPSAAMPNGYPPYGGVRSASASATTAGMTSSSTPLGNINAARRAQPPTISSRGSGLNVSQDILARIQAVHLGRQGVPPPINSRSQGAVPTLTSPVSGSPGGPLVAGPGGIPANFKLPPGAGKPAMMNFQSAPAVPNLRIGGNKPSLAEKRGIALPGGLPGSSPSSTPPSGGRPRPGLKLSQMNGTGDAQPNGDGPSISKPTGGTMMDKYAEYLDTKTGSLRFKGKAILNSEGIRFSGGNSFSISLDEVDTLDELGKGNYGTVYKVKHSRPRIRRPGLGLAGNRVSSSVAPQAVPSSPTQKPEDKDGSPTSAKSTSSTTGTGVIMAMKEIRLELDDAKFAAIIMELDILHRCASPYIVDFYGAFFQEGAVYICIEFMDGGSIDKIYGDGVPENVLRKITLATTMGLKFLKEEHNIIHRDVKPTNILVNSRGQVKICDFGVSGNLVASIAKTNIGCQSYMAPERISSGGIAQAGANPGGGTYSVQSDIWSLGLTIIECAMGRYPYPPETYNNIFSQLSVRTKTFFLLLSLLLPIA
jgi:mitogen-activated protein kinase kinase